MASPSVSTPSSAGSPLSLAPAPSAPLMHSLRVPSIAPSSTLPVVPIATTKKWTIPPRPKPGRKPATDSPPTKRKAQNRAAQRAFRERRAARVGELEEQLEETKEEQMKREEGLRDTVAKLEADVRRFSSEIQAWRLRCDALDQLVEYEKSAKEAALNELAYLRHGSRSLGTEAVPLPPRRAPPRRAQAAVPAATHDVGPRTQLLPAAAAAAAAAETENETTTVEQEQQHISCGDCTSDSRCACMEHATSISTPPGCGKCEDPSSQCECLNEVLRTIDQINSQPQPQPQPELKRAHSSSQAREDLKRTRPSQLGPAAPLEIDFTEHFSGRRPPPPTLQTQPSRGGDYSSTPLSGEQDSLAAPAGPQAPPTEPCGFCEPGTYCVCAEAQAISASTASSQATSNNYTYNKSAELIGGSSGSSGSGSDENRLAPMLSNVTPPPSEGDVTPDGTLLLATNNKIPSLQPSQMHGPLTAHMQQQQQQQRWRRRRQRRSSFSNNSNDGNEPSQACVDGPGTCLQCRSDPKSGLFCRSLAALRSSSSSAAAAAAAAAPRGCCGGRQAGGCCTSGAKSVAPAPPPSSSSLVASSSQPSSVIGRPPQPLPPQPLQPPPPSLSCADTYKTLSSHRGFDRASDELGTWLGRLSATTPLQAQQHAGRTAMDVDAASVMGVLKFFDRRFGRD